MLTQSFRSTLITLLLFVIAGMVIAASAWTGGGQVNPANLAEIGRSPAVGTR
ncbi:MAG: hypothetical protein NTV51_26495 [Verrucomicrobia bacterium]|nr:hypothetical protein [Verrucomicrobiota bacterium]